MTIINQIKELFFSRNLNDMLSEAYVIKPADADYMPWAAGNGHHSLVEKLLPHANSKLINQALVEAAKHNELTLVERLIPLSDTMYEDSAALHQACVREHMQCVKMLLPLSDVNAKNGRAGVGCKCVDIIAVLVPHCNALTLNNMLLNSIKGKRTNITSFLIPHIDCIEAKIMSEAIIHDDVSSLRKLLSKPSTQEAKDEALYTAVFWRRQDCIELLYNVGNPKKVLQRIQKLNYNEDNVLLENFRYFLTRIKADEEQKILAEVLTTEHKPTKKKNKI